MINFPYEQDLALFPQIQRVALSTPPYISEGAQIR